MHRADRTTTNPTKMFKNLLHALFGFSSSESSHKTRMFTDYLLNYTIIKAKNDCDEERFLAEEKENDQDLDILVTKCKRLLSFVESRGLQKKYTQTLVEFGNEIEHCVQIQKSVEPLFDRYEEIKKMIKGNSMSSTHLSQDMIYENIHLS